MEKVNFGKDKAKLVSEPKVFDLFLDGLGTTVLQVSVFVWCSPKGANNGAKSTYDNFESVCEESVLGRGFDLSKCHLEFQSTHLLPHLDIFEARKEGTST